MGDLYLPFFDFFFFSTEALLALLVAFVCTTSAQVGWSPFLGGLEILQSTTPSPWGNATNPGSLGQINAPTYVWGGVQSFSVTAPVVFTIPLTNACTFVNTAAFRGKIVFFSLGGYCSHAQKAQTIAEAGGVGAIFGELSLIAPSWDSMAQDQEVAPQLTIPVNFVGVAVSNFLISQITAASTSNVSVIATMTYQLDPIYAWTGSPSFIFIQTWFCIWFGILGIIALVKLLLFIREQGGIKSTVPQICLFLCFWSAILFAICVTLNFLGSRNNTTQLTMVVFREFVWVTWIAPALVFPFYWGEVVSSSQAVSGLSESKIPFVGAIIVIQGFTLAVMIVKGCYGSNADVIKAQICTVVILVGLAGVYFTVQGLRVIFALRRMQDGFARTAIQRRTTVLFLCLAVLLFCFVTDYSCAFAPGFGIAFPNFLLLILFFWGFAALGLTIMVAVLSPKALKEVQMTMSSIFSASTSANDTGKSKDTDVEMEMQIKDTKIVI